MSELEVAAYLDRRLPAGDCERMEAHLAGCPECREEVVETQALLARARRPRQVIVALSVIGAAALLLLVLLPAIRSTGPGPAHDPLRNAGAEPPLVAVGPLGETPMGGIRFIWGLAPGATMYRLTVSGADGVPRWTASTQDTMLALPDSVQLQAGVSYFWMTDALLSDGATKSTGLRGFRPVR